MKNLLRRLCWNYANQAHYQNLNVDYEELMAEANLAYLEALQSYDETKGRLTTYVWHTVSGTLKNYLAEELKHQSIPIDEIEVPQSSVPYFEKLTNDAQDVAKVILDVSDELICLTQEDAKRKIVLKLVERMFPIKKITRGMKDLSVIYQ